MRARVTFVFLFIGSYGCFCKTAEGCNLHYKIPYCMEFSNCEVRNVFYIGQKNPQLVVFVLGRVAFWIFHFSIHIFALGRH